MNTDRAVTRWSSSQRRRSRTADQHDSMRSWDTALRQVRIPWRPEDRLVLLYGHEAASRMALAEAGHWAMAGEPVVYLDGDQSFDPLFIARMAKSRRLQPRKVLAMIHVARVFSGVQMDRLVGACLAGALDRYQSRHAVVTGTFEMLADESVSERERIRTADRLLESLRHLADGRFHILCPGTAASALGVGRRLFDGLRTNAHRAIRIHPGEGLLTLQDETGAFLWEGGAAMAAAH